MPGSLAIPAWLTVSLVLSISAAGAQGTPSARVEAALSTWFEIRRGITGARPHLAVCAGAIPPAAVPAWQRLQPYLASPVATDIDCQDTSTSQWFAGATRAEPRLRIRSVQVAAQFDTVTVVAAAYSGAGWHYTEQFIFANAPAPGIRRWSVSELFSDD